MASWLGTLVYLRNLDIDIRRLEEFAALTDTRCFRKLLGISYKDHNTSEAAKDGMRQAVWPCGNIILTTVKWLGIYQDQ